MANRVVRVTVINDYTCANCYIGQHELMDAISYCKDTLKLALSFEVEHKPFRLISDAILPEDGPKVDKATFYKGRIGKDKFESVEKSIHKWAQEKGIPISFRGVMSQSTRAHRLTRKAYVMGGQTLQLPVLCGIFKANLEEGADIGDINVLAEVAENAGMMSKDEAVSFLKSDEMEQEINEMCEKARDMGIKGVPLTIIDGKWALSGGQSSDVFVQIFQKLAAAGCCSAPSSLLPPVIESSAICT